MIFDTLKNAPIYAGLSANFAKAFEYLQWTDLSKVATGKYEIDGTEVYAIVNEYTTKDENVAKWEAHEVYTDIQVIISGEERMGYAPIETLKLKEPYNAEKDILFLEGEGIYLDAKAGTFAVFFPQDAHKPNVDPAGKANVKKVIIKLKA
jgi:YhcH/YjgK/YiaL family protein